MNNNKIHSDKIEASKKAQKVVKDYSADDIAVHYKVKLPPPPCQFHDYRIPPPPCGFQPPVKSYKSRRSFLKSDDPFLIAYKECTKSSKKDKWASNFSRRSGDADDHGGLGLKMSMGIFSCTQSCSVVHDSIVKDSKPASSRSRRESHGDS